MDLEDHAEEDYIDMEVSSYSTFLSNSMSSPPCQREFEFQMSSITKERDHTTSPADELFYKGKLLPLHLPPRLQMVEKLLQNSAVSAFDIGNNEAFDEFFSTPLATTAPTPTATSTPFESCNISPSESFRISRELIPDEYFYEYSTDLSGFMNENSKNSWAKKLKHSSLGSKIKASRAYLKSLFVKSSCSDESSASAAKVADEGSILKSHESLSKFAKKKCPFGQIQREKCRTTNSSTRSFNKEKMNNQEGVGRHRRSFSLALRRHSTNKWSASSSSVGSSSSSCSNNSNGVQELPFLKRCGSSNSEIENSIQGAIAHCKKSQQQFCSIKTTSEVGIYSLSASRIGVLEEQERPELCRG